MKGTQKSGTYTNIKRMSDGLVVAKLTGGQYLYGNMSSAGTDLVGIDHYYDSIGTRIELGVLCKVSISSNLVLSDESETTTPTSPPISDSAVIQLVFNSDGSIFASADGNQAVRLK